LVDHGVVSFVRRWWYVLVLCPIVAGLAGFAIVQRIPSVYEASGTVAVHPVTGTDGAPDVQAAQALADSYAEQIHSGPVLIAAARSIGLTDVSATDLGNMVQARRLTNTPLVRLSVQTTDANVAAQLANAIASTFISQNTEDETGRYTSTQNNLVGLVTQLQDDQDNHNHQIDGLRAEPASPERDAQIGRLQDQVAQLQASQAIATHSLQDLQLAAARSGSELSVVDPAVAPTSPIRPNRLLSVVMAVLAGVFAGVGLAWLAERLDDRLRDAPGVFAALQLPTLARIPQARSGVSACNPIDNAVVASFSELRGNVLSALQTLRHDQPAALVAVSSAHDGDGKSAVAANLATALGHTGRRVILVDADLGRPSQASLFKVKNESGLAALLMVDAEDAKDLLLPTCAANVQLLVAGTAGFKAEDPSALLLSRRLPAVLDDLRQQCDVLVLDTPSVLGRPEGAWLSARADATVLVLDARQARKRTVEPALSSLREAGASVIGVVLNRVRGRSTRQPSLAERQAYGSALPRGASSLRGAADSR
jgi:capsular exopolysaccharide synthesis family protein